ncbi:MAG: hypothetical protein IH975_04845 [Nitrospinae bacterium]|nr:hypothetical protein [Nitrospinota bacterium]
MNKQTSFPGDSYTPEGSHDLSAAKKREEFEEYRDEVFEYTGWDKLLEELGIPPIKPSLDDLEDEAHAHNELLNRRGGGGENDEHRKLKEFIANHPKRLGISPLKHFTEFDLLSGDTVDVAFDCGPKDWAVVEVKVGQRGELIRGVYQAIKYRALMVAEKGRGKPFGVTAHLVAYEMPKEIERLARLFQVKTHNVPKAKVFSL